MKPLAPEGLVSGGQTDYYPLDWDRIDAAATEEQQRWKTLTPWSREAKVGRAVVSEIRRQKEDRT